MDRPPTRPPPIGPQRVAPRSSVAGAAVLFVAAALAGGCDRFDGRKPTVASQPGALLEPVADRLEPKPPTAAMAMHLDSFVFRSGELRDQHRVQHFCGQASPQVLQCATFDGTGPNARLTGVQYVISESTFEALPDDEKVFWHSQVFTVKAGALIAPGLPEDTEHALARRLVRTYAKTWRIWPSERDGTVPLGVPQLMMGFTRDGQLDPVRLAERDRELGVANSEKRRQRADLPDGPVAPGAEAWQQGRVAQVRSSVVGDPPPR